MDTRAVRRRLEGKDEKEQQQQQQQEQQEEEAPQGEQQQPPHEEEKQEEKEKDLLSIIADDLKLNDFRELLKAVLSQEGILENVDLDRELRILRDTPESKRYFYNRYTSKGVQEATWRWFVENPEDIAMINADTPASTALADTKDDGVAMAKAIASFEKKVKLKAAVGPETTYTAKFRRQARDIESKIKNHVHVIGVSYKKGYHFFRSVLTNAARTRFDRWIANNMPEEPGDGDPEYSAKISRGIAYLCDEIEPGAAKRNFREELRRLERKQFQFVDTIYKDYSELLRLFPMVRRPMEDQPLWLFWVSIGTIPDWK